MTGPWQLADEVGRDELEDALRFVYAVQMHSTDRAERIEGLLFAVVKALVDGGTLERATFDAALARQRPERPDPGQAVVTLGPPVDKYQVESPPGLDCAELLHLCKARCCKLSFPLTPQDLDAGRISWDYGRPFHILHGSDHACVHQERGTGRCTVYADRPATCRSYDCREDERVWLDFESRVPAPLDAIEPFAPAHGADD